MSKLEHQRMIFRALDAASAHGEEYNHASAINDALTYGPEKLRGGHEGGGSVISVQRDRLLALLDVVHGLMYLYDRDVGRRESGRPTITPKSAIRQALGRHKIEGP